MIREAVESDIPALMGVAREFVPQSGLPWDLCEASMEAALRRFITADEATVFIGAGGGAAGVMVIPCWMNSSVTVGQELFWWGADGDGMPLLAAIEDWARRKGAALFAMMSLEALRPHAVAALYRRRGYRPTEHVFVRSL